MPPLGAKTLPMSALLLAMDVVLYKLAFGPSYFQVSFGFLSMALMGYLYGPMWAGFLEVLSTTINSTLFGTGNFHPIFLITAFLGGAINGIFLYRSQLRLRNIFVAQFLILLVVSLMMNSWFISIVYKADFSAVFWGRSLRNVFLLPIHTFLGHTFLKTLENRRIFHNL
ncbi:membrane protein [Streptococcus uberis]|nr:membrane protein [Streptococcus uberis]